jgi:hypothetical protein
LDLYFQKGIFFRRRGGDHILLFPANPAGSFCRSSQVGKELQVAAGE